MIYRRTLNDPPIFWRCNIPYPLLRMYHRGYTFPLAIIFFTVQRQDILASSAIA